MVDFHKYLFQAYDVLKRCFEEVNCPFDDLCYNLVQHDKSPKKKTKKGSYRRRHQEEEVSQPPSPHSDPIQVLLKK